MKTKKIGRTTTVTLTYLEWVAGGKVLPQTAPLVIDGITRYIIKDVPEDKKEYFESLGLEVRLVVNKGKGMVSNILNSQILLLPAQKKLEEKDLVRCILKSRFGPKVGNLGFCYDMSWFNLTKIHWQSQHLHIISNDSLNVGDWCMFYGQLSKVLEINGESAKIETISTISKEDAQFVNRIKGKVVVKEGDFTTMTHSFSAKSLPKVIASTDKSITPNSWIPESYVKFYVGSHNNGNHITNVELELLDVSEDEKHGIPINEYTRVVKTNEDGSVIIKT